MMLEKYVGREVTVLLSEFAGPASYPKYVVTTQHHVCTERVHWRGGADLAEMTRVYEDWAHVHGKPVDK